MLKLTIERLGALAHHRDPLLNPEVEVWRDKEGVVSAYAEILGEQHWIHLPGLASFRFSACGDEVAAEVPEAVRDWLVIDAYRRKVLPMALQVCGYEVLHASAVRSESGVTALCGVSEVGKSTIAYGLRRRGYSLWADDTVAFEFSANGPSSVLLPFDVRLRPPAAALFSHKSTLPFHLEQNGFLPPREIARLWKVCILRQEDPVNSSVSVRRLSLTEAFSAGLEHACCFIPQSAERKRRMIHNYLDLAAQTAFFEIYFRPGLENLPAILDAIEEVLSDSSANPLDNGLDGLSSFNDAEVPLDIT